MITHIQLSPDMASGATQAVFDALELRGGAGCVRFVGGCVRNALMDRAVSDIDLSTQLTPDETEAALKAANIRSVPTGKAFGTISAVVDHKRLRGGDGEGHSVFEITSLREDVETDGRRAVVKFTTDWSKDALRRDFYVNALYADREGEVFDPTGQGLSDALQRRVRFIGEAEQRIREDYLRILRFFRFSAGYANKLDAASLEACVALKGGIDRLSGERIWGELNKMLALPRPLVAFEALQVNGIMPYVLQGWTLLGERLPEFAAMLRLSRNAERRLIALMDCGVGLSFAAIRVLRQRLKFSTAFDDRLKATAAVVVLCEGLDEAGLRRLIYRHGKLAVEDALYLLAAHAGSEPPEALLKHVAATPLPIFPVKGGDLIARGMKPGPDVGARLQQIEADWVNHDFSQSVIDEALDAVAKRQS